MVNPDDITNAVQQAKDAGLVDKDGSISLEDEALDKFVDLFMDDDDD